jgi:uncharacterized protein (DUF488 family)
MTMALLYTIGHSTHSTETLIELLTRHGITAIADVRSSPHSRFNPQFNRENLRMDLKRLGIAYVFLGSELGARSEDPRCYVEGKVQYDRLARTELFQEGLRRITRGVSKKKIALMCAEKDPLTCHRAILICRHLPADDIGVQHILEDGRLESHADALTRLQRELDIGEPELFRSRDELIIEAYSRRGEQIAYSKMQLPQEGSVRGAQQ